MPLSETRFVFNTFRRINRGRDWWWNREIGFRRDRVSERSGSCSGIGSQRWFTVQRFTTFSSSHLCHMSHIGCLHVDGCVHVEAADVAHMAQMAAREGGAEQNGDHPWHVAAGDHVGRPNGEVKFFYLAVWAANVIPGGYMPRMVPIPAVWAANQLIAHIKHSRVYLRQPLTESVQPSGVLRRP